MFRWLALRCLKLAAMLDESVVHLPSGRQSLDFNWCNINNKACLWRCKDICLDTPECMRCGVRLTTANILKCQRKNTNDCPHWYFEPRRENND